MLPIQPKPPPITILLPSFLFLTKHPDQNSNPNLFYHHPLHQQRHRELISLFHVHFPSLTLTLTITTHKPLSQIPTIKTMTRNTIFYPLFQTESHTTKKNNQGLLRKGSSSSLSPLSLHSLHTRTYSSRTPKISIAISFPSSSAQRPSFKPP